MKVGQKAPEFSVKDDSGKTVKLSDFKGKKVVLYFYPKDDTPGCTVQACDLRDNDRRLISLGVVVLGVSADSSRSHKKFAEKFDLPFRLLSDTGKEVIKAYGAWQKKKFMGKEYMGIVRSTAVIGPDGKIIRFFPKVKAADHLTDIMELVSGKTSASKPKQSSK
jgi:peroxiredoxin Q/BCP